MTYKSLHNQKSLQDNSWSWGWWSTPAVGWCLISQDDPAAAKTFLQHALAIYERMDSPEARRLEDAIRRADDQD